MTHSTGKQPSLGPQIHPSKEGFSSSTSTFQQTTLLSPLNLHSLQESTTQTLIVMELYVWIFLGLSGHLPSPSPRCCCPYAPCCVTPTLMTLWSLRLPGCTRLTYRSTMSVLGSGLGSTQCEEWSGLWKKHFSKYGTF